MKFRGCIPFGAFGGIDSACFFVPVVFVEGDLRWASNHVEQFASGPGSTGVFTVGGGWLSWSEVGIAWQRDFEPGKSRILKPGTQRIVVFAYIWVV